MFYPLSNIYAKTPFLLHWNSCEQRSESSTHCCFWSTVSKRTSHFEHSFLIDKCSGKMVNILYSDIFYSSYIPDDFNLGWDKTSFWIFLVFSGRTAELVWPEGSAPFVSVRPRLKSAYHLLSIFFWRSRVRITLIKLMLSLKSIFVHQKAMLYQQIKFRFFFFFENLQQ